MVGALLRPFHPKVFIIGLLEGFNAPRLGSLHLFFNSFAFSIDTSFSHWTGAPLVRHAYRRTGWSAANQIHNREKSSIECLIPRVDSLISNV